MCIRDRHLTAPSLPTLSCAPSSVPSPRATPDFAHLIPNPKPLARCSPRCEPATPLQGVPCVRRSRAGSLP
eukprot:6704669-Alexandrium_andersonii.AAC.1